MPQSNQRATAPRIIPRSEHRVSRQDIDENALKVLYRLHKAGFEAFLVGGGVRDLLLGKHPKDFDIATNALPEQVNELFRNCRLIGRRFRLAHIHFGREIVEVATFRGHHDQTDDESIAHVHNGMIMRDNVFGTLEEDAWRRDFTVNALYYNIANFSVIDYTGGIEDLQLKRLRMIGDAHLRCQEDPVRILRAIRFAAKLDFQLDSELVAAIDEQRNTLQAVPPARLFDELIKLFLGGYAQATFRLLVQYDLLQMLFALSDQQLKTGDELFHAFLVQALENTDARVHDDKPVTPAFLFAAMLWGPVSKLALQLQAEGMSPVQSLQEAGRQILHEQVNQIAIPKRFRLPIREIWVGQARLKNRRGRRASWLSAQPRFRAIYDFLLLRQQAGEAELEELSDWWTEYQAADNNKRKAMCQELQQKRQGNRPRKKK